MEISLAIKDARRKGGRRCSGKIMARRRTRKASAFVLLLSTFLLQVAQPHQVNTASLATAKAAVATTTRYPPHQSPSRPPPTEATKTSQNTEHYNGQQRSTLRKYQGQRSTSPRGIPPSGSIAVVLRGGRSERCAAVTDDTIALDCTGDEEEDEDG
ncbi:unnamed protein product, partial [Sphacelaria rigidula]